MESEEILGLQFSVPGQPAPQALESDLDRNGTARQAPTIFCGTIGNRRSRNFSCCISLPVAHFLRNT